MSTVTHALGARATSRAETMTAATVKATGTLTRIAPNAPRARGCATRLEARAGDGFAMTSEDDAARAIATARAVKRAMRGSSRRRTRSAVA